MSDTNEIVNGCLTHYNSRHIQVRRDFFDLCAYDRNQFNTRVNGHGKPVKDEPDQECMAKILRVLETLTNTSRAHWQMETVKLCEQGLHPKEPKDYPIPLTYGAIAQLLYGTHGESTIRNSVAALLERTYMTRFQETKSSVPYYILNTKVIQEALKTQAEQFAADVTINSQPKARYQLMRVPAWPLKSPASCSHATAGLSQKALGDGDFNSNKKREKKQEREKKQKEVCSRTHTSSSDSFSQDITEASERLDEALPVVEGATLRVTRNPPMTASPPRPVPMDKGESASQEKIVSTPVLSTNTATSPQGCAKVSPGARASSKKAAIASPGAIALSPKARVIFDAWSALFKVEVDLTVSNAQAAEKLVKPLVVWGRTLEVPVATLLKDIMNWLYATDTKGYYKRGVKLFDIAREFEGWQSAKEREMSRGNRPGTTMAPRGDVLWQGRWMSYEEADDHGWNGGFGEFVQHTVYARSTSTSTAAERR